MAMPKILRHMNIFFLFCGVLLIGIRVKKHLKKYGFLSSPSESMPKKSDIYAKYIQKIQNKLPNNQIITRSTGDIVTPPSALFILNIPLSCRHVNRTLFIPVYRLVPPFRIPHQLTKRQPQKWLVSVCRETPVLHQARLGFVANIGITKDITVETEWLLPSLQLHFANFFKFMAANLSLTQFLT